MIVKKATPGMSFDVNYPLSTAQYKEFAAAGYSSVIRYIPRTPALLKDNLTASEINIILGVGLALSAVQHVALPGWEPSADIGTQYGEFAAEYAASIGLPTGMNIWLDLEEAATSEDVDAYCRAWIAAVVSQGYVPGLYVGYGTGLSDQQLYDLPVKNYWRSYNCDQSIPTRGYQILQHTQKTLNGITFDPNTVQADELGDFPIFLSPS